LGWPSYASLVGFNPRLLKVLEVAMGFHEIHLKVKVKIVNLRTPLMLAFYPPWDGKMSSKSFTWVTEGGDLGTAD